MIGDSYSKDIAGGKNLDMTTIWIDNYQNNLQKPTLADYTIKQLKDIIPIFNKILQIS
jgi:2-haloacid dehalogenase/putative hydrolase of the HAD superfamily